MFYLFKFQKLKCIYNIPKRIYDISKRIYDIADLFIVKFLIYSIYCLIKLQFA